MQYNDENAPNSQELENKERQNVDLEQNDNSPNCQDEQMVKFNSYERLPKLLQDVTGSFDERNKDMILLCSLTVISSVLPKVFGTYNHKKIRPNLFLYILGKASSGKGDAAWTKQLVSKISRENKSSEEASTLLELLLSKGFKGDKLPPPNDVIIPADSSSAGFIQIFEERDGQGLIFETEGDTLGNILKSDYGDYSNILRMAWEHETISKFRKGEGRLVKIEHPELSVLITSTPNQLKRIIKDAENGLFSRFLFGFTQPVDEFLNVFSSKGSNRCQVFESASQELVLLYDKLLNLENLEIELTENQQVEFVSYFNKSKSQLINLFHQDLDSSANRMGVSIFRIIMILTVLRNAQTSFENECLVCSDDDFSIALELAELLLYNASEAINLLPRQVGDELSGGKLNVYQVLPNEFSTSEAKVIGGRYGLGERTIDRFIKSACFEKVGHGRYKKVA